MNILNIRRAMLSGMICFYLTSGVSAVTLEYAGSQANIGGTFFPGAGPNYVTVPWRTSSAANTYATSTESGQQYYGRDGYALFATTFSYPNANAICCDPAIDPELGDPLFPNIINLPEWVADSQILATRMAGGYGYSLIDDPQLMSGIRHWTFDGVNYPAAVYDEQGNRVNGTNKNPWVKMGFLDGGDILGNNPTSSPTGRWGFQVGADTPSSFRVGVMTGGMDSELWAPGEVFIQQYEGLTPIGTPLGTGSLSGPLRDRFVDMHFFDIIGAQEGDQFVFGVLAGSGSHGPSGIAGFSFDVLSDVPAGADFDGDGDVDGRDFLAWQRGDSPIPFSSADLTLWQSEYNGGALMGSFSVPEPSTAMFLLASLLCLKIRRF